jgi:hypothetical protein
LRGNESIGVAASLADFLTLVLSVPYGGTPFQITNMKLSWGKSENNGELIKSGSKNFLGAYIELSEEVIASVSNAIYQ